jgi:hypothetical protein
MDADQKVSLRGRNLETGQTIEVRIGNRTLQGTLTAAPNGKSAKCENLAESKKEGDQSGAGTDEIDVTVTNSTGTEELSNVQGAEYP